MLGKTVNFIMESIKKVFDIRLCIKIDYGIDLCFMKPCKKRAILRLKNARGDISRAGIINHSMSLLRALLECGYYSREGLI